MENSANYVSCDNIQKRNVSRLIDEFADDLIKMSGKCMDIGCGPGDITKNILLPSLDPNATIIGKQIINILCIIIIMHYYFLLIRLLYIM